MHTAKQFSGVLQFTNVAKAVAVDIPIGLPEITSYPRTCDLEAQKKLEHRWMAVFPCPPRAVVNKAANAGYKQACAIAQELMGKAISQQTYNILAKIKEVDLCLKPSEQRRVIEVHPEICFWSLNGKRTLSFSKKESSRRGIEERLRLLRTRIPSPTLDELVESFPRGGAGLDDVIDALVAAYTAKRYLERKFFRLPQHPNQDARGLRMEMIVPC